MRTIETSDDIAAGLKFLARADGRLKPLIRSAGALAPRRRAPGFAGLARIVVGQQVSVASADAIWGRCLTAFPEMTPQAIACARMPCFRQAGLSLPKIRTLQAAAAACRDGLDLDALASLPAEAAHAALCAVKGIGPWTADIYLLFCLGHPDIFPAGDLALRIAVADAFGLDPLPRPADLAVLAQRWSPWRSVAATVFWAHYSASRKTAKLPV
jgi:DNA-3-methyladenine glycosylase II